MCVYIYITYILQTMEMSKICCFFFSQKSFPQLSDNVDFKLYRCIYRIICNKHLLNTYSIWVDMLVYVNVYHHRNKSIVKKIRQLN